MNLTQLTTFFLAVVLSSAFCFGLHVVVKNFLDEAFDWTFEDKWHYTTRGFKLMVKPLFACPYCMASIWGTVIFFVFLLPVFSLAIWPVFCICLCGFNYVVNQFVNE